MTKAILCCLLLLVVGCAIQSRAQSIASPLENATLACVYNTLERMEGITKVWMSYDCSDPHLCDYQRSGKDGIEFEGERYVGFVYMSNIAGREPPGHAAQILVYTNDNYWNYRQFPIWDPEERMRRVRQFSEQIKESLLDSCDR